MEKSPYAGGVTRGAWLPIDDDTLSVTCGAWVRHDEWDRAGVDRVGRKVFVGWHLFAPS
jgi:hypothetical protein